MAFEKTFHEPGHAHAAPTELGWKFRGRAAINMALLTELGAGRRMTLAHLPIRLAVIFKEFAPDVMTRVEAVDNRIDNPRPAVHDVQRRMELMVAHLAGGDGGGVLVGYPAGVHGIHINPV